MTLKRYKKTTVIFLVISTMTLLLLSGCKQSNADWAYYFVVWNGDLYEIDQTAVVEKEDELGTVNKYVESEGNYKGVFSNLLPKGAKLYTVKGDSTDEAIAVELDGTFVRAENLGAYGK